jgi:hypothetical protein
MDTHLLYQSNRLLPIGFGSNPSPPFSLIQHKTETNDISFKLHASRALRPSKGAMRLIHTTALDIHEFLNEAQIPPFAILSHTWEEDECTLKEMQDPVASLVSRRKGYRKIQLCCKQALKDGLEWVWIDTYAPLRSNS